MLFLIVDDHPLVCSALEGMLKTAFEPCELLQAHSAAEALETLRELEDLDLVLLDLKLPDVEGFQGLLQLRKAAPRIHILVLSGRSEEHTSELQSLMRISYAVICFQKKNTKNKYIIQQYTPKI